MQSLIAQGLALIFDMDGVIIHSNPVHAQAWRQYLDDLGISVNSVEERMTGKRNDEIVRDFFGPDLPVPEVAAHGAAKERLYRSIMAPQLERRIVPGLAELLNRCEGAPRGLATNAEPLNVEFVLGTARLRHRFHAVIDGHQVEKPKPHPEIYQKAAHALEVPPENCIVFEDSLAGVQAARLAGARVVGVLTTHDEFPDVQFTIRDFKEPELSVWLSEQLPGA